MKVTIHRGLRQIGGNIVEIKSDKTKLILDAGCELGNDVNPVDFHSLLREQMPDSIMISHYHADHIGLLENVIDLPTVYMGKRAYEIYKRAREYMGGQVTFSPEGWFENGAPIRIGDIQITPFLADHSAADAYSLLVEGEGKSVFYTGDFRDNGRKNYDRYLQSLPTRVDALICEGTTLSRKEERNGTEKELEGLMTTEVAKCNKPVFLLASAMNLDRIVTAYKAAKENGRIFLQDVYVSSLTETCRDIHVPNPVSFADVYAFTFEKLSAIAHERIAGSYGRKFIGREEIAKKHFLMCIRSNPRTLSYLRKLNDITPLSGSIVLYSMWEGYKKQPGMKAFLREMEAMGIQCRSMHVSGHADADAVRSLIMRLNPRTIIPIHTENEGWFLKEYSGKIRVCTKQVLEV